jgi:PAP2 superfamily
MQRLCTLSASLACLVLASWSAGSNAAHLTASQEQAAKNGTTLEFAVPATALLLTFFLEPRTQGTDHDFTMDDLLYLNGSPRHDLFLALGRTAVITGVLKEVVHEERPNGGQHSFPSGHTSSAFCGAEFIRKEYGWAWGAPAYAAATYVGWSRVEAKAHHWHDVVAGAAIGYFSNHDWHEVHTNYGQLSFAPAMLEEPGDAPAHSSKAARPGFGMQFHLDF